MVSTKPNPTKGNVLLGPVRLSGDPARDLVAVVKAYNDFFQTFVVGRNVYGTLDDFETRLTAIEADIKAIKTFVRMPT